MKNKVDELLRIVDMTTLSEFIESMKLATQIYEMKNSSNNKSINSSLSAIFQAGKIEGIRQERQRRKSPKCKGGAQYELQA